MKETITSKKIFCIAGTRPEYIKLYPVYKVLKESGLNVKWVKTGQHLDLVKDLELFFELKPDFSFKLKTGNDLALKASELLENAGKLFSKEKPDLIFVQGDTLTAQQFALAAFYQGIQVAHIEAGLRTSSIYNPFPEELSRRIVSQIADLNFAPSKKALEFLEAEKTLFKKSSQNFLVGNTVIDTLKLSFERISSPDFNWHKFKKLEQAFSKGSFDLETLAKNFVLVTCHRRENFGKPSENLCQALLELAKKHSGTEFYISVHKNPEARLAFQNLHKQCLEQGIKNIKFFDAINYPTFIKLLSSCLFVVTDSGGLQEEAPYFSKKVFVLRRETERSEVIDSGFANLLSESSQEIYEVLDEALLKPTINKAYGSPYGDGDAAEKIIEIVMQPQQQKSLLLSPQSPCLQ